MSPTTSFPEGRCCLITQPLHGILPIGRFRSPNSSCPTFLPYSFLCPPLLTSPINFSLFLPLSILLHCALKYWLLIFLLIVQLSVFIFLYDVSYPVFLPLYIIPGSVPFIFILFITHSVNPFCFHSSSQPHIKSLDSILVSLPQSPCFTSAQPSTLHIAFSPVFLIARSMILQNSSSY